jgi:hypothetical protein
MLYVTAKGCLLWVWNIYLQHTSVQMDHLQVLHSGDTWHLSFCYHYHSSVNQINTYKYY